MSESRPLEPLPGGTALIDQVYERLVAAIADGTLAPGQRLRQDEVAALLGVSRQPVSHALQLVKRQGLAVEHGRKGLAVAPIETQQLRDLYEVRAALDQLAAGLAAGRGRTGALERSACAEAERALAAGLEPRRRCPGRSADPGRRRVPYRALPALGQCRDRGDRGAAVAPVHARHGRGAGGAGAPGGGLARASGDPGCRARGQGRGGGAGRAGTCRAGGRPGGGAPRGRSRSRLSGDNRKRRRRR